jgi:hypothetical protein
MNLKKCGRINMGCTCLHLQSLSSATKRLCMTITNTWVKGAEMTKRLSNGIYNLDNRCAPLLSIVEKLMGIRITSCTKSHQQNVFFMGWMFNPYGTHFFLVGIDMGIVRSNQSYEQRYDSTCSTAQDSLGTSLFWRGVGRFILSQLKL